MSKFLVTLMVETDDPDDDLDTIGGHLMDHIIEECSVIEDIEVRIVEQIDD